jgi:hypothetical protein
VPLVRAIGPVIEALEQRQLMAGDSVVQALPFALDFNSSKGGLVDQAGLGTGFTYAQANSFANAYQPQLLGLDTASGVLNVTTTGNSAHGGSFNGDNSLVNGLQTGFNATTGAFNITARLRGPLGFISNTSDQGGVLFGPDQDNYVKFVAIAQPSGEFLQFIDEQTPAGTTDYNHAIAVPQSYTSIGSFSTIQTLDLQIQGDPSTGTLTGAYSINGGPFVQVSQQLTLTGVEQSNFFSTSAQAGVIAMTHNDLAPITVAFDNFSIVPVSDPVMPATGSPSVVSVTPSNGAVAVSLSTSIACELNLPHVGSGINTNTLNSSSVFLINTTTGAMIPSVVKTDGAGSVIVLQPVNSLDPQTSYTFVVTAALKDTTGATFQPFQMTFMTDDATSASATPVDFDKVALTAASQQPYTGLTMGPDGKLYAATEQGDIFQFPINSDGTLGTPKDIRTVINNNGGSRVITGITFDPTSTASNLILWVSHGAGGVTNEADWTGKISRLSGPALATYQDYVVGLPRSIRDHLNDQPSFGPDGALYWGQASLSAMGAADSAWGFRNEDLLSAAILRLDTKAVAARIANKQGPLDVQTAGLPKGKTPYNPNASGAPLTIYASGVRNAYDLVWDTNGHLYAPVNGSAAGGNTPATPKGVTPSAPALNDVAKAEDDFLLDVKKGGYYGHPDPARGQYILDGGNPTKSLGAAFPIVSAYPKGTNPDPNYKGVAFDFGAHFSPDGSIEYEGNAFGGALNGDLLVTEYSSGDDIIALSVGSSGQITKATRGTPGFTQLNDPVDLIENDATGYLYVAELGGEKLTLLKPDTGSGTTTGGGGTTGPTTSSGNATTLYFNDPTGGSASPSQTVTIKNTGTKTITLASGAITLSGSDPGNFQILSKPSTPLSIAAGASINITVAYNAGSSSLGLHTAQLNIKSSDSTHLTSTIALRALATAGLGGTKEPSLQAILNLYQIPDSDGTSNVNSTLLDTPPKTPNSEVVMQEMVKAGSGPVTITPIAVFSASITPSAGFGYYLAGQQNNLNTLLSFNSANSQTVNPQATGTNSFDPGSATFGVFSSFEAFAGPNGPRIAYSQDALNTWDTKNPRKVRFYPLKNPDGSVVPNAYVFATEDYNLQYDSNDVVGIIRNVKPASTGAQISALDPNAPPGASTIAFSTLGHLQNHTLVPNTNTPTNTVVNSITHSSETLRVSNSGTSTLTVSSISFSSSFFTASSNSFSVAPDGFKDITLTYKPVHTNLTDYDNATMTIHSNAVDTSSDTLKLSGIFQQYPNQNPAGQYDEPTVAKIVAAYGYTTVIQNSGQAMDQGGKIETVGDEVLSTYWQRADTNTPVTVTQLGSYHTNGNGAILYSYPKGSPKSFTKILSTPGDEAQTLLPPGGVGQISPNGDFGFVIDKQEYSDNALNAKPNPTDQGHHMRFWPAIDANGKVIPNTYIMAMDYAGINYDYNDNVFIISNIKPG